MSIDRPGDVRLSVPARGMPQPAGAGACNTQIKLFPGCRATPPVMRRGGTNCALASRKSCNMFLSRALATQASRRVQQCTQCMWIKRHNVGRVAHLGSFSKTGSMVCSTSSTACRNSGWSGSRALTASNRACTSLLLKLGACEAGASVSGVVRAWAGKAEVLPWAL